MSDELRILNAILLENLKAINENETPSIKEWLEGKAAGIQFAISVLEDAEKEKELK